MNVQDEIAKLARFAPLEKLIERTRRPIQYAPEPPTHLIPSFAVGTDGPTLSRILLVSENLLCDIPLAEREEFDYVATNTIRDYRFTIWDYELKQNDQSPIVFQIAEILLLHGGISTQFRTELQYTGDNRDQWIAQVLEAIPIATILQASDGPTRR